MDETRSCAVWGCFFIARDVFQQKADTHDARRLQSLKTMMGRQSAAVASTNHAIMCASIGMVGYPRSKIVGKRRAQRESHRATVRAVCRTLGIYPVTPMLARMLAWDRRSIGQIFAAAGVSRLPRPVCESMGERWRDGVSCLQTSDVRSYTGCSTQECMNAMRISPPQ